MISAKLEIIFINALLAAFVLVYVNLLFGGSKQTVPSITTKFVIDRDTSERWRSKSLKDLSQSVSGEGLAYNGLQQDDYYSIEDKENYNIKAANFEEDSTPIKPSSKFRCPPHPPDWITMRSELNYMYLWLHGKENGHMSATANMDTPLHYKAFEVVPVQSDCGDGGWVRLREGDTKGFLRMVPASNMTIEERNDQTKQRDLENAWAVVAGSDSLVDTSNDQTYHFLLEEEGYLLNRGSMAFVNVISRADYVVRGHSSSQSARPARREFSAMLRFQFVNETRVQEALAKEAEDARESKHMDDTLIAQIQAFPKSNEVRVISFGLYGTNQKYTTGAIRNTELSKIYFPGWTCRFYCTSDVPESVQNKLRENGAEVIAIPDGSGYVSGMFWRFLVAVDPKVDRFIIRDVDSRLNSRDAMAVHEWIESGYDVHIMRDHVNHCHEINGGMWGAIKGSMMSLKSKMDKWKSKDQYFQDMNFLREEIWPLIEDKQIAHDSYCCDRFNNARPFPTRRPPNYQHVGQVFDKDDSIRLSDIDGYIRGIPVPRQCRLHADWIYG